MGHWQAYLIAFMVGLLVGIEREKSHNGYQSMGIRTFLLISLLGSLAGGLQNLWISALITAFALALVAISYFNQTRSRSTMTDIGLTTEFAAGIVYCLGYITHESPTLAALAGPVLAVILFSKSSIHKFIKTIRPAELQAALLLFLSVVVVINLVPDETIDPWDIFNPKKFGYLVLILAILEFLSYVTVKIVGEKKGLLLVGFLGGFVSSTAVLLSSAKQASATPQRWRTLLSSTLAAKLAALVELLLIVVVVSPKLFYSLTLYVGVGILIGALQLAFLSKNIKDHASNLNIKSPLNWRGVFRLSLLLAIILALISIVKIEFGDKASSVMSFLTGLLELHGVSLANATMYNQSHIELKSANLNILLAIIASLVAKIFISWMVCRGSFSKVLTLVFTIMIIAIGSTAGFILNFFSNL